MAIVVKESAAVVDYEMGAIGLTDPTKILWFTLCVGALVSAITVTLS